MDKMSAMMKKEVVEIIKIHVFQNGRSIVNVNVAGVLFHTPSLLDEITLKVYVPGGRLE